MNITFVSNIFSNKYDKMKDLNRFMNHFCCKGGNVNDDR
jgi:hypothetical protein